ncbi:MAG TPA: FAD-dependent monooxygenase, partial [Cystobacter sp.]
MSKRNVLICGASIAGPALAFWLKRHGMRPVIVERAPELRTGGQSVDVRGAGQEVVRRMNLEQAIRARTTHETGVAFVDSAGRVKARISSEALGGKGLTAELEILRGEFARILHDATREDTEYLFGDRVASLTETGDRVRVGFLHGPEREFDL